MAKAKLRTITAPNLPMAAAAHDPSWTNRFLATLRLFFNEVTNAINELVTPRDTLELVDGVTAPDTISGSAIIYVDAADGDLKIKFGDGTVKTIVTD